MSSIDILTTLGEQINQSASREEVVQRAAGKNPWFIPSFTQHALSAITSQMLQREKLQAWLSRYEMHPVNKTIGLILAGNLPLVGFHDFLCAYVSGAWLQIKLSSKDDVLFLWLLEFLYAIDPSARDRIELVDTLKKFDAVIATGSDNSNRYFEYYFRAYPKILRKGRSAVAVLDGKETEEDLEKLSDDVFLYFGFGCRNVSKLYVHADFDIKRLFPAFEKKYAWLHQHNKFMSNYDYQRTILMLNKVPHLSNEFVMVLENKSVFSPIATLHFEIWEDEIALRAMLKVDEEKIQCMAAGEKWLPLLPGAVSFGETQKPALWQYADGVDTLQFLLSLK